MLFEREKPLSELSAEYERALAEGGRTVLVSGEAGLGKTSLIAAFSRSLPEDVPVHVGGCEALFAARPLGALFDIADKLDGEVAELLQAGADNHEIYTAFLRLISDRRSAGSVFVIEDIHWADAATMDFLKFIGRRIQRSHCLLIASYRDDEIGPAHPLRHVLGDLPRDSTTRIRLAPLSVGAIRELGHCDDRRAAEILEITDGNPFFVQELLSAGGSGVPRTVSDAILARASRLSADARDLLGLVSVAPGRCEVSVLEAAFTDALPLVDECAEQGLLMLDGGSVAFRHELARLAIEDTLPAGKRRAWNAHVLSVLGKARPDAAARLAHHAELAGDREAVLEHAPRAARQAARLGAHREAVALYRQALGYADSIDDATRGELFEHLAYEWYVTGRIDDAIAVRRECLGLAERTGDAQRVARSHRWLSRLYWFLGKRDEADRYAAQALSASEALDDTREYSRACSNQAQLYMLSNDSEAAIEWATKAIEIATANDDTDTLTHALNNLGTALGHGSPGEGAPHLEHSLRLALENNFQEHAARAYTNLASVFVSEKQYAQAASYLDAGIEYTGDRDLDSWLYYMQGWRARLRLETGNWEAAADDATAVTRNYRASSLVASPALAILARLRLRRGDPDFDDAFDTAMASIAETREIQRLAPLVATRAERAWLFDTVLEDADELRETRDWAERLGQGWLAGELTWWMRKLGLDDGYAGEWPEPYELLLLKGDWSAAAAAWRRIGCPYETALALAEGDEEGQREALQVFTELGAEPAAASIRKALRARGVRDLPVRQRPSTRANPAGLTNRQLAVLRALSDGLSDAEIAGRLFISPRTVSHHVSAILGKLEVRSRTEAAAVARRLGIHEPN